MERLWWKQRLQDSGVQFLRKLHKLVLDYNQLQFCTVSLSHILSNFKIIKEICERDKEKWK